MATLVSPAGDLEKLKYSVLYGADSVYLAGKDYGLRNRAGNFALGEMEEGIRFAHGHSCKVDVAINISARDEDIPKMLQAASEAKEAGADGVIVADAGLVSLLHEKMPRLHLTLSTQANALNRHALKFWKGAGVDRVVLARELSFEELRELSKHRPEGLELEAFVHGAMCISYSGRCLISSYLAGRDSNRGDCAQPCRWSYALMEEKRPGEYFPVAEDGQSTLFFNSCDLCLIRRIPDLMEIGIDAFKIEGRMKSAYYAAAVTNAYRIAMERAANATYSWDDLAAEL
ncbi:MAG: U32 family peptidase, partial [Eubacteriaceae bacterium]|nr:U32 family peptidase [Eubacteriaceae bacterium]